MFFFFFYEMYRGISAYVSKSVTQLITHIEISKNLYTKWILLIIVNICVWSIFRIKKEPREPISIPTTKFKP